MGSYYPRGQQIFVVFISLGVVFIFIFYKQARLSGVSAVSFAISECEWGVYFQGCHRNHCICGDSDWGCRPGKILLFLSWVNTWHTCMRAPCAHPHTRHMWGSFFLSLSLWMQMQADTSKAVSRTRCLSHIKQYTGMRMFHPFFSGTRHPETSSPWQQ